MSPVTLLSLTVSIWGKIIKKKSLPSSLSMDICLTTLSSCVFMPVSAFTETLRKEQKKVWFADSVLSRNETSSGNTTPTHRDSMQTHAPGAAHVVSADMPVSSFLQSLSYML